jgi:subtilase family serine protease
MPTPIPLLDRIFPVRLLVTADVARLARALCFVLAALFSVTSLAVAQSNTTIRLLPMVTKSVFIGEVDATQQISVVFSLALTDSRGAAEFIQHISDPRDPLYRHYLTPEEFAIRFGANEMDYSALKEWVIANRLTISQESIARTSLTVRGSVAQFEELFRTQLNDFRSPDGQTFYSASIEPTNGGSNSFRNVPDVAAVGNPSTGVAIYNRTNGGWNQIGGTSLSCPVWASYVSVLNAALEYLIGEPIGFLTPTLYSLGAGNPTTYLHDVTEGSNGNANIYGTAGYTAGLSYDNCSGCGSIRGGTFAYALLTSESGGTPPGALTQLTAKFGTATAKVSWATSAGATGYVILVSGGGNGSAVAYVTNKTKFEISGLEAKTKYSVQLGAVNQGGSTQSSITFTTK